MFAMKGFARLSLCLSIVGSVSCSGGSFLGGNGSPGKPAKAKTASASDGKVITTIDEMLELSLDSYYAQIYTNLVETVGDDAIEYEGFTFEGIASKWEAYMLDAAENMDMTVTLGDHFTENGVDPFETVSEDEFVEALDSSMAVLDRGLESGFALSSRRSNLALQAHTGYGPGFTTQRCTSSADGSSTTCIQSVVNNGVSSGSVSSSVAANAGQGTASGNANAQGSSPNANGARCGAQKTTYATGVMRDGKCVSQAQIAFEKNTASGGDEAKRAECQRQQKNHEIFGKQVTACGAAAAFGSGCVSGKDGANPEELAIASDQLEASGYIVSSCKQDGFLSP